MTVGAYLRYKKLQCAQCKVSSSFLIFTTEGDEMCVRCALMDICEREKADMSFALAYTHEHNLCAYCGETATDVEHVYPRCAELPTYTVKACSECNSIAGGTVFASFKDKRNYIHTRLKIRYKHILRMPEWDRSEIDELGRGLQDSVALAEHGRSILAQRLRFYLEDIGV